MLLFYCVATVSVIEVQLWRLTSTVHAFSKGLPSVQRVKKGGRIAISPLPPDSSGHDSYLSSRKQREWGEEKDKKLTVVLLG